MHFLVALLCGFKRKFEFFRWRVGVFNYYVLKFVCRYVFIDVQGRGFNIKIQENT